jgi:DNA uptake protein ComE-like DNA-binding protein
VYGFDAERLNKIENQLIIDSTKINKIDLNQVTFKNLLKHPYFEFHMVKAIVTYRQLQGGFKIIDDLLAIELMYSELYQKIRPYVSIGSYSPQTDARK